MSVYLWQVGLLLFELAPQGLHFADASEQATSFGDHVLLAIEPERVLLERSIGPRSRSRTQVILVERDRERRIGGQDELRVALAPIPSVKGQNGQILRDLIEIEQIYVLDAGDIYGRRDGSLVDGHGLM